jgi:hypothetical protein
LKSAKLDTAKTAAYLERDKSEENAPPEGEVLPQSGFSMKKPRLEGVNRGKNTFFQSIERPQTGSKLDANWHVFGKCFVNREAASSR